MKFTVHLHYGSFHEEAMATLVLTALMSALAPPTVVVAGATGRVGRLVVQRLLQREGTATTAQWFATERKHWRFCLEMAASS